MSEILILFHGNRSLMNKIKIKFIFIKKSRFHRREPDLLLLNHFQYYLVFVGAGVIILINVSFIITILYFVKKINLETENVFKNSPHFLRYPKRLRKNVDNFQLVYLGWWMEIKSGSKWYLQFEKPFFNPFKKIKKKLFKVNSKRMIVP